MTALTSGTGAGDPASIVGTVLPALRTVATRHDIRFFAGVIGETDPLYLDVDAARAAGFPDLLMPPTFLFTLELERPSPYAALEALGIEIGRILHGEQSFRYHQTAFAGEELEFRPVVGDYYEKKDGALRFVVRETKVMRNGELIAELTNTVVAR